MTVRILATILPLLLIACAKAPASERFVVIEGGGYGCGALESQIGRGLAVDPLLGKIDGLEGVASSRVAWDGLRFLIELKDDADPAQVAAAVIAAMDGVAFRASAKDAAAAIAAYRSGDRWLRRAQAVELSREEAREIAGRYAKDFAQEMKLDEEARQRLETVLREEFTIACERAHADGGSVQRLRAHWPEAHRRLEVRIAEFLTTEQAKQVKHILELDQQLDTK